MKLYSLVWNPPHLEKQFKPVRCSLNVNYQQLDYFLNGDGHNVFTTHNASPELGCIWSMVSEDFTNHELAKLGRLYIKDDVDVMMETLKKYADVENSIHGTLEIIEVCEVN